MIVNGIVWFRTMARLRKGRLRSFRLHMRGEFIFCKCVQLIFEFV